MKYRNHAFLISAGSPRHSGLECRPHLPYKFKRTSRRSRTAPSAARPISTTRTNAHSIQAVPILLPVLNIYSARNVYCRFSVLAVISEQPRKPCQFRGTRYVPPSCGTRLIAYEHSCTSVQQNAPQLLAHKTICQPCIYKFLYCEY